MYFFLLISNHHIKVEDHWKGSKHSSTTPRNVNSTSGFTFDISALTESYHRHWHFPRWIGHSKTCTFVDCDCHSKTDNRNKNLNVPTPSGAAMSTLLKKQNNQKMPNTMLCPIREAQNTVGHLLCTNLLAMVGSLQTLNQKRALNKNVGP